MFATTATAYLWAWAAIGVLLELSCILIPRAFGWTNLIDAALGRFLNAMPARFETAAANPRLNAVVIEADESTGLASDIERLSYSLDELNLMGGAGA